MDLIILDENSSFSEWANRWCTRKLIGADYKYTNSISNFIRHLTKDIGNISIKNVNTIMIDDIIIKLAQENPNTHNPTSKKVLKQVKNTAVSIFDYAISNCTNITRNPARNVQIPKKAPQTERRELTVDEQKVILKLKHRARLPAMIMLLCGLRVGEVIPLKWTDINWEKKMLIVTKSTCQISANTYSVKKGTKNGKSRSVPIPTLLFEELMSCFKENNLKSIYITHKLNGDIHTPSSWRQVGNNYLTELEHLIKLSRPKENDSDTHITFHMFRHTYASMLYFAGVDIMTASELLGHSDIQTTMKIYTHLQESTKERSIERYNDYINKLYSKI